MNLRKESPLTTRDQSFAAITFALNSALSVLPFFPFPLALLSFPSSLPIPPRPIFPPKTPLFLPRCERLQDSSRNCSRILRLGNSDLHESFRACKAERVTRKWWGEIVDSSFNDSFFLFLKRDLIRRNFYYAVKEREKLNGFNENRDRTATLNNDIAHVK